MEGNKKILCDVSCCANNSMGCRCKLDSIKITADCTDCTCCANFKNSEKKD